MSARSEAVLTTKPASTSRQTCMRAAALTRSCYLALYRVTLLEPAWRGVKKPDWCMYQSVSFEVRLYGHHADRGYQLLFRVDNSRNRGKTLASQEFTRWRDLLSELAQKDAARFNEAALSGDGVAAFDPLTWHDADCLCPDCLREPPQPPGTTPLQAAVLAAAEPNDAELGAKVRELAGMELGVKHRLVGREGCNFEPLRIGACSHGVQHWSYDKTADAYWCEACGGYLSEDVANAEFLRIAHAGQVAPRLPEKCIGCDEPTCSQCVHAKAEAAAAARMRHRDWCDSVLKAGETCNCPARAGEPLPAYYAEGGSQ